MTCRTPPAVPQDFPIQAAENEGMPPRPTSNSSVPPVARLRRLVGTLTLGSSKSHPATKGFWPGKDAPKRPPLARSCSRLAVVAGLVASLAFPVFAQDGTAPMPANAQSKTYGEGWDCDRGYRRADDECLAVIVPANAFATNRTYGAGWECSHGFREVDDATCLEVVVPQGGYLDSSGKSWSCLRGHRKVGDLCEEVIVPANAYLSDETYGSSWLCDRGYETNGEACTAIAVPENAFLNGLRYGQPWTCERGFIETDDMCESVAVPHNAFLDDVGYGPGWSCDRGFAASDDGCTAIDLPDNAHLDRSGNRWECHSNFRRSQGRCLLND